MRVLLEPLMYNQLVRSTGDKLDLWPASEVRDGQSSRTEPLTLWDLIVSPGRKHQNWIELNCRTLGWRERVAWSNGGKLHILERLNMRTETVKLLKENIGQNPLDIGLSNYIKNSYHSTAKKNKQCDLNWAEELNRYFSHRRHTDG